MPASPGAHRSPGRTLTAGGGSMGDAVEDRGLGRLRPADGHGGQLGRRRRLPRACADPARARRLRCSSRSVRTTGRAAAGARDRLHGRRDPLGRHRHRLLGRGRLPRRHLHRLPARLPRAEPRPALDLVRPAAPAAHLGRHLRLRRQRPDRDQLLRRAAHLRRPGSGAATPPGSSSGATTSSSCSPPPATCSATASPRSTPSPNGTSTSG